MGLLSILSKRRIEKTLGERGEGIAARYLRGLGYRIVARRDRSRIGELDLVAVDGRTVVFIEVKTRRPTTKGEATDAVDTRKQRQLTRAALTYLKAHGLLEYHARFDVIAITWPAGGKHEINHIQNAFPVAGDPGQWYS